MRYCINHGLVEEYKCLKCGEATKHIPRQHTIDNLRAYSLRGAERTILNTDINVDRLKLRDFSK